MLLIYNSYNLFARKQVCNRTKLRSFRTVVCVLDLVIIPYVVRPSLYSYDGVDERGGGGRSCIVRHVLLDMVPNAGRGGAAGAGMFRAGITIALRLAEKRSSTPQR
ncbi:unnamed protein product [Ascophyllum nodosum]